MTERELPKAENAALKAFITSDRLNFVEEVGVKANAKANAAAKSTIRLVDPPIGNENWPKPRFRSLRDFCAEYQPIAEVVGGGVLYSGSLYTLTAKTGTGKTSWLVTTALGGVTEREILGRPVKRGRYAFCTAENPDGLKMRLAVGCSYWNIDQDAVGRDLLISDNRARPEEIYEFLARESEHGEFTGIFVDTWQAFFDG